MTENTPKTETNKPSNAKFILPIVAVVVVVAGAGFVAMQKKGFDKQLVESQLNNWIATTKQHYPTIRISYGQIEMQGGVSDRHALIGDVRVERDIVNEQGAPAMLTIAMPQVKIQPKSVMFNAFDVSATQGVHITEDADHMQIAFDAPPVMHIENKGSGEAQTRRYHLPLIGLWTITNPKVRSSVSFLYGEGSSLEGNYANMAATSGDTKLHVTSLKIESRPALEGAENLSPEEVTEPTAPHIVTIGATNLDSRWSAAEGNNGAASLTVSMQDIFSNEAEMPYGAISLKIDGDYNGPFPQDGREIDWTSEKALFDLREFSISAKDVSLNAKLNFQTGRGEVLPIGEGLIEIKNFAFILAEMKKDGLMQKEQEELLGVLAKQTTGLELSAISDLSLPLKRVDGGSLQVGKSNFEELFAIVLTGGKLAPNAAPVLDVEEAPLNDEEVKELFNE